MNGSKTNKIKVFYENIPKLSEKLIGIFLILFVVFSPVSIAGTHIALSFAVLFWFIKIISVKNIRLKSTPLNIILICFFAVIVISVLTSVDVKHSIRGIKSAVLVIIYFLIINNIISKYQIKRLINLLIIITTISALYGIFQHFTGIDLLGHNIFLQKILPRSTGFYGIPMTFAEYISMVLMVVIGLLLMDNGKVKNKTNFIKKNIYLILSAVIITAGLYFSFTRGAWVGGLAGLLFLMFLKSKRIFFTGLITVAVLVTALVVFYPKATISKRILSIANRKGISIMKRTFIWETSLNMIKDYPVTGVGWECYRKVYPKYVRYRGRRWREFTKKTFTHAHNNFLNIAVETGFFGLGIFVWVIVVIIKEAFDIYRKVNDKYLKSICAGAIASLIVFIVSGMTEYTFGDSEIVMLFYFLLGILFVIPRVDMPAQNIT